MAFASQLQPSAPLWSKELSVPERGMMGVRAPDSLPGLTHHYTHNVDRSPSTCNSQLLSEASPTSSEESHSPVELNCYRRLGDKPPLMKRLAMGLSGALLQPSDDDSTPLVADTPTTPTNNLPLCMNEGYINEASDAEFRTRESNRDSPRRGENHNEFDDFRQFGTKSCGSPMCGGTSTSTGSWTPGSNNNEPDLQHASWYQAGIPREIALEVLAGAPPGTFLVRRARSAPGCLALSLRVPAAPGVAHYLIVRGPAGYRIKGFTKEFRSLSALVTHHSVMPELLPVPLTLQRATRPAPPPATVARRTRDPRAER